MYVLNAEAHFVVVFLLKLIFIFYYHVLHNFYFFDIIYICLQLYNIYNIEFIYVHSCFMLVIACIYLLVIL